MSAPRHAAKSNFAVFVWIACAFAVGIGIWGVVFWMTEGGENGPRLLVSVGTSGLALAFGGVLGGVVKKLFDAWDDRKQASDAQSAYFTKLLGDFTAVYNMVERTRFLIAAHKSAKTYGERLRDLPDAIILLHNVKRATRQGFPDLYKDLEAPIFFATMFLKNLVTEYRDNYLRVSRLQSLDEIKNKDLRAGIAFSDLPEDTPLSHAAWDDIKSLPHLKLLLDATDESEAKSDNADFETYEAAFVQYIDVASYCLMLRMPGSGDAMRDPAMDQKCKAMAAAMKTAKAAFSNAKGAA